MNLVSQTISGGALRITIDSAGPSELVLRLDDAEIGRLARAANLAETVCYEGPIPPVVLRDGITILVVTSPGSDAPIAQVPIVMGEVLRDDAQTALALLRSEVDMLKAALRRSALR